MPSPSGLGHQQLLYAINMLEIEFGKLEKQTNISEILMEFNKMNRNKRQRQNDMTA